jgi:hypothetical protein
MRLVEVGSVQENPRSYLLNSLIGDDFPNQVFSLVDLLQSETAAGGG